MAVRIGDVTIRIGASTKQLENDLRRAERSLQATADKFQTIGTNLTLGITAPLAIIGGASFKMASDFEESLNKVRVAFGESAGSVEEFAKTTITSIGLAEGSALEMASLFGDMATSMGLTRPAAAEMSKSLVTLAGDLASFKNIGIEEAQTALAGVFTGETESLKRLGVVMTEANVQAYALTQGITKKLNAMTQAEKVSLRYAYVMSVTKNAQGDFARTAGGAANQMRTTQEALKEAGQALGKILLPAFTAVITKINSAIKSFTNLDSGTKNFIISLAGVLAALGPVIYIVGVLKSAYGKIAVEVVRVAAAMAVKTTATAAETAATTAATAVTLTFNQVLKATLITLAPYALALGAIAAVAYAVSQSLRDAGDASESLSNIQKQAAVDVASEKREAEGLIAVINDETKSKNEKKKALLALQDIIPEYFKGLTIEKDGVKKINEQYEIYINNLKQTAVARASQAEYDKIAAKRFELQAELNKEIANEAYYIKEAGKFNEAKSRDGVNYARTNAEQSKRVQEGLKKELEGLIAQEKQIDKLVQASTILNKETKTGGGEARGVKTLKTLETTKKTAEDLIPLFADLAKETEKSNLIKLGQSVRVVNPELNQTATFLKQVGDEIAAIQVRADRGFITQAEADIEKAGRIKQAIQDATEQGLGTGVVDGLQGEFDKLNVNKLTENLEGKLKKIVEFVGPIFSQLGATFGAIFAQRGAEIDQYYEKEKARIEGSLMTEESKAAAIQKLDEQTQKKKAALARKQAILDKASAIFSASVEGASAIIKGLKYGPIYAGIIGALVAAQIAAIAATPLPSLAIGTDMVKRDGLAMIHKGEAIVPANVVKGGFTGGGGGQELYGRLSGLDIVVSNRNAQKYLNRIG